MKTLMQSISKQDNQVRFLETIQSGKYKLRIIIESDHVPTLSTARLDVFAVSSLTWNMIAFIDAAVMATKPQLAEQDDWAAAAHFHADRANLLQQACDILNLPFSSGCRPASAERYLEVVADIAMYAGSLHAQGKLAINDSRDFVAQLIHWAKDFEHAFRQEDHGDTYLELIDMYASNRLLYRHTEASDMLRWMGGKSN